MLKDLIEQEQKSFENFFQKIDLKATEELLDIILKCQGVIFFSGVGKSGLVAKKIAATFTSTGTRALYLSPIDALHGDIGMVTKEDIFILISKSGENDELFALIPYLRNKGAFLIAIVSNEGSRMGKGVDKEMFLPIERELCPFNLAPITTTSIQLVFGNIQSRSLLYEKVMGNSSYSDQKKSFFF